MFRRFMEWLGYHKHDWKYGIDVDTKQSVIVMVRYCPICHELEEVPADMRIGANYVES